METFNKRVTKQTLATLFFILGNSSCTYYAMDSASSIGKEPTPLTHRACHSIAGHACKLNNEPSKTIMKFNKPITPLQKRKKISK